jgi:menaquinone-specific isochorismate synthase
VSLEGFDRGWYAGPVGWVGPEAAEFTVAIRSGLLFQKSLSLYSGAGIVRGSTPDEEWDEIEQKIIDFIKVFGLDLRRAK